MKALEKAEKIKAPINQKAFYIFAETQLGRKYIQNFINSIYQTSASSNKNIITKTPTSLNRFFELNLENYRAQFINFFRNNWIGDGQKIPKSFYLISNTKEIKKDKEDFPIYGKGEEFINFDELISPSKFEKTLNGIDDSDNMIFILLNFLNGLFMVAKGNNWKEKSEWINDLFAFKE